MARNLLACFPRIERSGHFRRAGRSQIKEMLLAFGLDNPLAVTAVNPALVPSQLLQHRGVLMLKFLVRS